MSAWEGLIHPFSVFSEDSACASRMVKVQEEGMSAHHETPVSQCQMQSSSPTFQFPPGFEPHGMVAEGPPQHIVDFHVHHGVTIRLQMGDKFRVFEGKLQGLYKHWSSARNTCQFSENKSRQSLWTGGECNAPLSAHAFLISCYVGGLSRSHNVVRLTGMAAQALGGQSDPG